MIREGGLEFLCVRFLIFDFWFLGVSIDTCCLSMYVRWWNYIGVRVLNVTGLNWVGVDWIGFDWIGLDWIGLDWGWIDLNWIGLNGMKWNLSHVIQPLLLQVSIAIFIPVKHNFPPFPLPCPVLYRFISPSISPCSQNPQLQVEPLSFEGEKENKEGNF